MSARQLLEFMNTNHVYVDDLDEEQVQRIREAAEREEENLPVGITKRKGKSRRSSGLRFPSEWANSRSAFQKAVRKFEVGKASATPQRTLPVGPPSNTFETSSPYPKEEEISESRSQISIRQQEYSKTDFTSIMPVSLSVPREVLSLFSGLDKLDLNNWNTWK
ncbi:hypothetical protein K3495_g16966, partial [Podosphaera aphanis]